MRLNGNKSKALFGSGLFLTAGFSILMFQNCGGGFSTAGVVTSGTTNGLVFGLLLGATKATVPTGGSVQMNISGGTVPYQYTVSAGSISATGLYTAPASITGSSLVVTVKGFDSTNMEGTYNLTVVQGMSLYVTYSPTAPARGQVVTLSASNGLAPYTYYMEPGSASGAGAISGNSYTAGSATGTDTILATDSNGDVATVAITID